MENTLKWDGNIDSLDEDQRKEYERSLFRRAYGTDTPEALRKVYDELDAAGKLPQIIDVQPAKPAEPPEAAAPMMPTGDPKPKPDKPKKQVPSDDNW